MPITTTSPSAREPRTISLPLSVTPITFWTFSILRDMWHLRPIMKPAPKIYTQPIGGGVRTTQKTHCPQRASQISSAKMQDAIIWSRSAICTSAAENGAGDIWAFMFCSRLWNCKRTQNLVFVRSCVPNRVQPVERRNARTQKIEVHFLLFGSEGALKSVLPNQWLCKQ